MAMAEPELCSFDKLKQWLPKLMDGNPKRMSPCTKRYNCLAWAAGCARKKWAPNGRNYWPNGIPPNWNIDTIVRIFGEVLGYERCDSEELEPGWEKVAIYASGYVFEHAARQKETGKWTSKLGNLLDIDHDTLDCLAGGDYGSVVRVMKRRRTIRP